MTDFSSYVRPSDDGFHQLDLEKLATDPPPPPEWVWEGLIERGELVWIAGPGKVGKSLLALSLAAAIGGGRGSLMGRRVGTGYVTVIDCENSIRTIAERQRRLDFPEVEYFLARGGDLGSPAGLQFLQAACCSQMEHGDAVVILDSLIGLHRIDEDKAAEVRRFVSGIRSAAEKHGATVIGLAHENRGGNMRGSLDWRNAADTVLELRKDDKGWRTLKVADRRNGEEGDAITFRFAGGPSGELQFVTTAAPQPGLTAVEVMAQQLRELLPLYPDISQSEAARRLGTSRDNSTFRRGWAMARAGGEIGPGGLGSPLTGEPTQPTQPRGGAE